ncbi:MAG: protein kinase [Gammaproteobacteria bacterium]|nr:protein kinase [Gammaproteobacteria bacterium]
MLEIPGYSIQRIIGHGGMATVYLAVQESLGREVALKVLLPSLAKDPVATERFLREARFAAQLHHPNIVAIHDVGVHEGSPYMAMGYEPGGTIANLIEGREDPRFALRVVRDIAGALDYAHGKGVVHRDVKPENILRRLDGSCVLSDFGIAHALATQTGLTTEGSSIGTPHYMSPEQLRGEKVDGRADLYSLGVVFYQLLTGHLPYQGTDGWAIGMQHISAPIPRLPEHLGYLQPLVDALLAKDPAHRVQTGGDLVRRVEAAISGNQPLVSDSQIDLRSQPARRSSWLIALPIGVIVIATMMFMENRENKRVALAAAAVVAADMQGAGKPSIAVLPLADMSEGKDQEYFSDGLSEELINLLAQVPELQVVGRTSAFSFKGKNQDLKDIGRKLGVTNLLEGSVRKTGDKVRITVQLINAQTGFHLWSQTYDRDLTDVYAVQDEIAAAVVSALKLELLADATPAAHRAVNPQAYTAFLRARQIKSRGTPDTAREGVEALQEVIRLDPGFAAAHAQLAVSQGWAADYAQTPADVAELQRRALAAADKAIELDPNLADGYWARGNLRATVTWDWEGARSDFQKAVALNPGDARILQGYGALLASLGRLPEAIETTRKAAEAEPLLFSVWQALGYYQEGAGQLDQARLSQERALALKPKFPFVHFRLGVIDLQQHQPKNAARAFAASGYEPLQLLGAALAEHDLRRGSESQHALDALIRDYGHNAAYQVAQAYAWRGQKDEAFQWLDRAFAQRDGGLAEVKYDPLLRSLRKDPRYRELLGKMGLPQ